VPPEPADQNGPEPARATGPVPGARLVVRIGRSDVGSRVSVRHRYDERTLTDVVGVLESWEAGVLRVRRRDGSLVEVAEADLVAGKVVPPAPSR
jgi:hypothetical protein